MLALHLLYHDATLLMTSHLVHIASGTILQKQWILFDHACVNTVVCIIQYPTSQLIDFLFNSIVNENFNIKKGVKFNQFSVPIQKHLHISKKKVKIRIDTIKSHT